MAGNEVSISVRVQDMTGKGFKAVGAALRDLTGGAVVPAAAAVAALGVQLVGAGAAVGVFAAAVAPQAAAIKNADAAQTKYNDAVRTYGKDSKQAQSALSEYKKLMQEMDPATQDTARSFQGLKSTFSAWSDSLASSTMPVFTHAMEGLKNIFPLLTPLVKSVSAEFLVLTKRFEAFSKTDRFKQMVLAFGEFAAGALKSVISGIGSLAKVVGGWVTSDSFQDFIAMGAREGPGLAKMFQNLAQFVGRFVAAAGPLAGLQLKVLEVIAKALNAIPMPVLQVLVPTILGIVMALRLWTIATKVWTVAQAAFIAVSAVNPIFLIAAAIAALIVVIVLIATKTTWFQTLWSTVWGAVKTAFSATVDFLRSKAGAFVALIGPLGAILWIAANWGKVKAAVGQAVGAIVGFVKSLINWVKRIVGKTIQLHQKGAQAVIDMARSIINWVRRIAGKTINLMQRGASAVVNGVRGIINWVRRMAGKTISVGVRGATAAIKAIQSVINWVRNLVGKTINIGVNVFKKGLSALNPFAHGGVVGAAAAGGPRSNSVMVGEYGPEIVDLAPGSRVRTNADSRRILSQGGGGGAPIYLVFDLDGRRLAEVIVDPMRKVVSSRGGVRATFGKI